MRHKKIRLQLNRFTSWRRATLISIVKSLLWHQTIKTTKKKAQAARPLAEGLVSLAKENTLAAKRAAFRVLGSHRLVKVLFGEIGPRFHSRNGGYTRIINLSRRRGDNAQLVVFELTEIQKKERRHPKKEKAGKPQEADMSEAAQGKKPEEKKQKTDSKVLEKPPVSDKPPKKFLSGLRNIFKKQRDSL